MAARPKPKPEPAIAANDAEVRPVPLSVIAEGIPQSMKDRKQWVCWSYVQKNGKWTKPPFSASGDFASSTKPETWATFDAALSSYKTKHHDGIGFVLAEGDGLAGIDLDHCINDGQLSEEAQEIVDQFQDAAYIERSPGGDGVRLFVLGSHRRSGKGKGKDKWVEVYDFRSPRYLTVTGHRMGVQEAPQECPEGLEWLHEHYLKDEVKTDAIKAEKKTTPHCAGPEEDEALINRMRSFKNQGQKFVSLFYNANHCNDDGEVITDESAADMALVELLAFACSRDEFQMDRIFRQSALMRDKWDNKHSADGRTYGQMTIGKALKYNEDKGGKTLKAFDGERSHQTGDTTKGKAPYTLLTFEDLKASGHALELVENVLPASGTACIYGQSGAGKTFLALNLMMAISGGDPTWFGYNVMQRPVIYFGLEGMQGFKDRLEAHCMHEFNDPPSDDFRAVDDQFNLIDSLDHKRLIDAVRSVGFKDPVVVIDTMTRATPGLDLNGPADMGLVIEAVSKIQRQLGGLIIVIYHSTSKTNGSNSTELGHSSFRGSLDASIFVHSDESGAKSWSLVKSKDAEDGKSHPFVLVPYEVRRNQWGNPKMSCAVEVPQSVDSGRTMPENMALGKLMADYISEKWNGNPRHYFSKDQLIDSARPDGMSRSKAEIAFSYLQLNKLIELRELPPNERQGRRKEYWHLQEGSFPGHGWGMDEVNE